MAYDRTAQDHKTCTCSCLSNYLYFVLWKRLAERSFKIKMNDHFLVFFFRLGVFSPTYIRIALTNKNSA